MNFKDYVIVFGAVLLSGVTGIAIGSKVIGSWLVEQFSNTIFKSLGLWLLDLSRSIAITLLVIALIAMVILLVVFYYKTRPSKSDYYDYRF